MHTTIVGFLSIPNSTNGGMSAGDWWKYRRHGAVYNDRPFSTSLSSAGDRRFCSIETWEDDTSNTPHFITSVGVDWHWPIPFRTALRFRLSTPRSLLAILSFPRRSPTVSAIFATWRDFDLDLVSRVSWEEWTYFLHGKERGYLSRLTKFIIPCVKFILCLDTAL